MGPCIIQFHPYLSSTSSPYQLTCPCCFHWFSPTSAPSSRFLYFFINKNSGKSCLNLFLSFSLTYKERSRRLSTQNLSNSLSFQFDIFVFVCVYMNGSSSSSWRICIIPYNKHTTNCQCCVCEIWMHFNVPSTNMQEARLGRPFIYPVYGIVLAWARCT